METWTGMADNKQSDEQCIVEYGTLFELAASYKHDSSSFLYLLSIIFRYNMVIATRKGFDADRLCNLIYSGRYLSDLEQNEIFDLLLIQTSDAICNLLAQFFYISYRITFFRIFWMQTYYTSESSFYGKSCKVVLIYVFNY